MAGLCGGIVARAAVPSTGARAAGTASVPAGPVAPSAPVIVRDPASALREEAVQLDPVQVKSAAEHDRYDVTGLGYYEHQLRDTPFSNDLISADAIEDDPALMEQHTELAAIATPSAVDLATGDSRVALRGFPTPQLSNGFVRVAGVDILNTARTVVIQGALVPVLGRAAPGGIQDFYTNRPRPAAGRRLDYSISSLQRQTAAFEVTGPAVPKRAWQRVAADWNRKMGPETFSASETRSVNTALTWKHSASASTLFAVDYLQVHATSAPGIPEYRLATGGKIIGPYRPIAGFNALGPEAGVRRRSTIAMVLFDAQPHPKIALRAGIEAWWRRIEQDRFTTSLLNLQTARFEGIREPRHIETPQTARVGHVEATGRFSALGFEHKLMFAASHTEADYLREERALSIAARNALPASVRNFDPRAPDYSRPAYSTALYDRVLSDRRESPSYSSLHLTERLGTRKGRVVLTIGVRQDFVGLKVDDRRVGATMANVRDRVQEMTYHTGVNYQALPSRLLLFATTSTAFNPSTRVDARTGRIQGNEMTRGHEAGLKTRLAKGRFNLTASAFTFINHDISRRNPLYDDPVFDANHTQPQLVAAGEERFTGGKVEGSWRPHEKVPLTLSFRGSYVDAITTKSPDLPEEVGRPLTRYPPASAAMSAGYSFGKGRLQGVSVSGSWSYIAGYVANYEDRQRIRQEYPGYDFVTVSTSYSFRKGKFTHAMGLSVRNLFDYDYLRYQARLDAQREFTTNYRIMF